MAAAAIDEAVRNLVAVGASLDRCALLDNFCWGDCGKPEQLGGMVRAARACRDFAIAYGTPFISGKDSLNNEFHAGGRTIAIPGTLLVSAVAVLPEGARALSMDLKEAGNFLYAVGLTKNELGASRYYALRGEVGANVPRVDAKTGNAVFAGLAAANPHIRSLHDCSEGGLAVAAAEMAFAGGLGAVIDLDAVPASADAAATSTLLFSESASRFVAEVAPADAPAFESALTKAGAPFGRIGTVEAEARFVARHRGRTAAAADLATLKAAWQRPFPE
jgi:phosphoribosylformylglycinamidine synthase